MSGTRPIPVPTALSQRFWDGCREGVLLAPRCEDCGRFSFPPQELCRYCHSRRLQWVATSGRGEVHSFTTVWRPQTPAFEVPYVVAIVRLDEGFDLLTNLVGCDPGEVRVGARVEVSFQSMGEMTMPTFTVEGQ